MVFAYLWLVIIPPYIAHHTKKQGEKEIINNMHLLSDRLTFYLITGIVGLGLFLLACLQYSNEKNKAPRSTERFIYRRISGILIDTQNFVFHLPCWRRDFNFIADFFAEQSAAY